MNKKAIIFGTGQAGVERCAEIEAKGKEVEFYVDNFRTGELNGKMILSFAELLDIYDRDIYDIYIATKSFWNRMDIAEQLDTVGIVYNNNDAVIPCCIHVYTERDGIEYYYDKNYGIYQRAIDGTIPMIKETLTAFNELFEGKELDFYVFTGDSALEAERIRRYLRIKKIFAYATEFSVMDTVIPIPDYKFYIGERLGAPTRNIDFNFQSFIDAGKEKWLINKIYYSGNIINNESRRMLMYLSEKYSDILNMRSFRWERGGFVWGGMVSMGDFMKYKYLIDVRGVGWTDRVKYLLAMNRPLFLVDRPYKEYYFDKLIPMEHFVPIKEDFSDLEEKYYYMEAHPDLYDYMTNKAREFVIDNFMGKAVYEYLSECILKYGTV